MTKKEIQQLMAIARPAIIAVYGRQSLQLEKYRDVMAYLDKSGENVWLQVDGYKFNSQTRQYDFDRSYKLNIESGRVTSLCVGELDI